MEIFPDNTLKRKGIDTIERPEDAAKHPRRPVH